MFKSCTIWIRHRWQWGGKVTAKKVGKIYNEKQDEITHRQNEISRVTRSIEIVKKSAISEQVRSQKQIRNLFLKKHELNREIDHHQLFINIVNAGKLLVKEYATDRAFDWFCQNNFDGKDQIDIAVDEDVSHSTVTRAIAELNKRFMSYVELELLAFLDEEKDFLKMIRKGSEK